MGRQRGRHDGGGIALDDDAIGFFGVEHVTDSGEQPCGQPVERLARFHQVEIHVGSEPGDVEHLIEQPAMLRRHAGSEEHTSELQSLMSTSSAVFCLKTKNTTSATSLTSDRPNILNL